MILYVTTLLYAYISKSKKLIELEEPGEKPIAKTAPKQSVGSEEAYAVLNMAYNKITHTQPMICGGYSVVGPNKVHCKIICTWFYIYDCMFVYTVRMCMYNVYVIM